MRANPATRRSERFTIVRGVCYALLLLLLYCGYPQNIRQHITVDVCIAAIERDLHNGCLQKSLESIRRQTFLPKAVILVVSNTNRSSSDIQNELTHFLGPVQLKVKVHRARLMQSEGRNVATSYTTSDLVSFMDADDFSHPQRLEIITREFSRHKKLRMCLHEYVTGTAETASWFARKFSLSELRRVKGTRYLCKAELMSRHQPHLDLLVHHAHVTVRKEVFTRHLFDETAAAYRIEDSLFVRDIIAETCHVHRAGDLRYIQLPLSFYTTRRDQCQTLEVM